jgi:tetratricopeptide (TPR) repeat protein
MEKDKQLIPFEGEQALVRVNVQMGLVNKVLEEDKMEYWTLHLNKLKEDNLFDDLLAESENCICEFPNWNFGYSNRGMAKRNLKDYKGAILDHDKAIELNPNSNKAYNNRGIAKSDLKDYEGAILDYDKAIELNPNSDKAYNNRGIAKMQLENYESALEDVNKALELDYKNWRAYGNRVAIKSYLKDFLGALEDCDEVIKLNPNYHSEINWVRERIEQNIKDYEIIKNYERAKIEADTSES